MKRPRLVAALLAYSMAFGFAGAAMARGTDRALPTPTTWIEANNVSLRYQLFGKGPTVVLLHEMTMTLETWDYLLPTISPGHQILRYDLRGFGLSEKIRGAISIDDEVADLRALLGALNINDKVVLVGGAVGGAIALKYAAVYPRQIAGVFVTSPAAYMKPQPERVAAITPTGSVRDSLTDLDAVYPKALRDAHPDRLERLRAIQLANDPDSHQATIRMIYSVRFADILPKIQCPTVVVATSLFVRPVASFKELADAVPKGKLEVIETGHFAAIESPELVSPLLLKFLKQVE